VDMYGYKSATQHNTFARKHVQHKLSFAKCGTLVTTVAECCSMQFFFLSPTSCL
jgi:hypothetical protein